MPFMLQPKNYTQIARPNLYNAAYRRVGAYKGMGRLHPTNYLEIGLHSPNRMGGTSGQYNTMSGQLMLYPPSLRGLGQAFEQTNFAQYAPAFGSPSLIGAPTTGAFVATQFAPPTGQPSGYTVNPDGSISASTFTVDMPANPFSPSPSSQPIAPALGGGGAGAGQPGMQQALPWILGGAAGLILLMGMRR
jgi:hypothetical protein